MISKRNQGNQARSRRSAKMTTISQPTQGDRDFGPHGTVMRTKSLLMAALRVWELKQPEHTR
jgi:hypothetical protein